MHKTSRWPLLVLWRFKMFSKALQNLEKAFWERNLVRKFFPYKTHIETTNQLFGNSEDLTGSLKIQSLLKGIFEQIAHKLYFWSEFYALKMFKYFICRANLLTGFLNTASFYWNFVLNWTEDQDIVNCKQENSEI